MAKRTKIIPYCTDDERIYTPDEVEYVLSLAPQKLVRHRGGKGKVQYYNIPCAFDIETTSFYVDETGEAIDYETKLQRQQVDPSYNPEKRAIMYVWQFGINGRVIIGRTWQQFTAMMERITAALSLNRQTRLMVFVHNLAYEFQFMREWFSWSKIFALDTRKPVYAVTDGGVEFRCSYILSGYGLAKLGDQLRKYHVEKMVGDLDYSLMRHSETPLTDTEIGYCANDVKVVMAYIQEKIEDEGHLGKLPITKTGYVRRHCKNRCLYSRTSKNKRARDGRYTRMIKRLAIQDMDEYHTLRRAFAGGFTHANATHSGDVMRNVASYDFTSSYPYVMVSEQFPMSRGVLTEINAPIDSIADLERYAPIYGGVDNYLFVMDVSLIDVLPKHIEHPLSVSKCYTKDDVVENNGRVVTARRVDTTITCVDFKVLKSFYDWRACVVTRVYAYKKGYLPTNLVKCILELYANKTILKGVEGKELEYLKSKEMINSVYGMSVMNPLRDEHIFDGDWHTFAADNVDERLFEYNESKNRFLFYPWGVFITAYARRNLFTAIDYLGDDYVYADTDSVKFINHKKHKSYFEAYNRYVEQKLNAVCEYHNIDTALTSPATKEGEVKTLGVWDYEGTYKYFKTLGAKRYMVSEKSAIKIGGKSYPISITVAGVNKKHVVPYLWDISGENEMAAFNKFSDDLVIPADHTGKNTHTYIDNEQRGFMRDYLGNVAPYYERSSVHLEPTSYEMSISARYADYLKGHKEGRL